MSSIVTEVLSGEPLSEAKHVIQRDERLLLRTPGSDAERYLRPVLKPLAVYGTAVSYAPVEFASPKGVFEGPALRLEWQTMDGRQPFYHRNVDAEEISFQVCGARTLITERGTLDLLPGQFSRIPVGVAHDNRGFNDIHLIFYFKGPVTTTARPVAFGQQRPVPFEGWVKSEMFELCTNSLGGPNGAVAYSMIDEDLLIASAALSTEKMELIAPGNSPGVMEWLYRSPTIWIGHKALSVNGGRVYLRRLHADEIQYQIAGTRTIISQRGAVTLAPGDFVCIERGCAYTETTNDASKHLSLLTSEPTPAVREPTRFADLDMESWLRNDA